MNHRKALSFKENDSTRMPLWGWGRKQKIVFSDLET